MSGERALSVYLRARGTACYEAADYPRLRPLLFRLLELAPKTIRDLEQAAQFMSMTLPPAVAAEQAEGDEVRSVDAMEHAAGRLSSVVALLCGLVRCVFVFWLPRIQSGARCVETAIVGNSITY